MRGLGTAKAAIFLCGVLMANTAWAEGSPFVGQRHGNRDRSVLVPSEPARHVAPPIRETAVQVEN